MSKKMSRYPTDRKVYVGDLGNNARKNDLEYTFSNYGTLRSVWVARNPPGFAFVEFEDARDAADAVRALDGRTICGRRARVELSTGKFAGSGRRMDRSRGGGGGGRSMNTDDKVKCYECGGKGHYARECRRHARNRRRSNSRSRSRSAASRGRKSSRSRSPVRSRENGRGENGDSSRYSDDDHNGGGGADSPVVHKRRYDDSSPSPKRSSHSKRGRSDSRRHAAASGGGGGSSISRSRSSSRKD